MENSMEIPLKNKKSTPAAAAKSFHSCLTLCDPMISVQYHLAALHMPCLILTTIHQGRNNCLHFIEFYKC